MRDMARIVEKGDRETSWNHSSEGATRKVPMHHKVEHEKETAAQGAPGTKGDGANQLRRRVSRKTRKIAAS